MLAHFPVLAASRISLLADQFRSALQQPHSGLVLRSLLILVAGGVGLYLMLPRGRHTGRRFDRIIGAALATLSLVLLATVEIPTGLAEVESAQKTLLWSFGSESKITGFTFYALAAISLVSAVMMITSRNPVYSALWFAVVLLGNSGLFLLQGAEFLSAATIIVYAGAIVVTFLFVIMLAQPSGAAKYDHVSREPLLSCLTGLILSSVLVGTLHYSARLDVRGGATETSILPSAEIITLSSTLPDSRHRTDANRHVAGLGKALFLDHVVSVEVIGVLLLAAVVGAMLIAGHPVHAPGVNETGRNKTGRNDRPS